MVRPYLTLTFLWSVDNHHTDDTMHLSFIYEKIGRQIVLMGLIHRARKHLPLSFSSYTKIRQCPQSSMHFGRIGQVCKMTSGLHALSLLQ